jgi:hypothetical protein
MELRLFNHPFTSSAFNICYTAHLLPFYCILLYAAILRSPIIRQPTKTPCRSFSRKCSENAEAMGASVYAFPEQEGDQLLSMEEVASSFSAWRPVPPLTACGIFVGGMEF